MKRIETSTEIDAPAEAVWEVLTEFAAYPEWNPFIPSASGETTEGARLRVEIKPPGSRGMTFQPRVTAVESGRRLEWLGRLLVPGLFDGRHEFFVEPLDGGVRLVHRESFSGVLVGLLLDADATERGFVAMNRALKRRAEARAEAGGEASEQEA